MWQIVSAGRSRIKNVELEDGVLKPGDEIGPLWPFEHPSLPTRFAKVYNARSAIAFELDYAPLGYDYLVDNPEERKGGDPLNWVLEHSKFVKFGLNLMHALKQKDIFSTIELIEEHTTDAGYDISEISSAPLGSARVRNMQFPAGAYYVLSMIDLPSADSDILMTIPPIVASLVTNNTKNMHEELFETRRMIGGRFEPVGFRWILMFNSLIEVIWSMVGELAVKSTGEGEYFRRCELCKTPFLASDKRQRFCPPDIGKQSLCGLKYRQHKLQVKKKRGGTK